MILYLLQSNNKVAQRPFKEEICAIWKPQMYFGDPNPYSDTEKYVSIKHISQETSNSMAIVFARRVTLYSKFLSLCQFVVHGI